MKLSIETLKNYIPPKNTGFRFVKRAVVYFPIKEVGLHILERKQQRLSLVYETILKLISLGIKDIEKMAELLGLEVDVYKEVIAQMSQEDIIYVTELTMGLTSKGKEALQDQKKVTVEKNQLNRIFVNQLTGEIYDDEPNSLIERPQPSNMCLDGVVNADLDYFRNNFITLSEIFKKNSASEVIFSKTDEESYLYRIIDIAYENTHFASKSCYVYISEDDNSFMFSFENDKDSQYMTIALNQINKSYSGAQKIFDNGIQVKAQKIEYNEEKGKALNNLLALLEKRSKTTVSTESIESLYYSDRYLLDGEIRDLLISCEEYKPKHIIIISPFIKRLFEDNYIVDILASINAENITIYYDQTEYGVVRSLEFFARQIGDNKKDVLNLYPLYNEIDITGSKIIIDPGFQICVGYEKVQDNSGHELIKKIAEISFDKIKIQKFLTDFDEYLRTFDKTNQAI
jgi:predicted transcriptional regulator